MSVDVDSNIYKSNIIETRNLTKKFGEEVAVDSMDMEIPEGTIFGFIGPSGCGKTTTIRLMTGIYSPTSGDVNVLGKTPHDFSNSDREKIGYLLQQYVLYPELTVWENLNFAASFYGVTVFRRKLLNELLEFVELAEHKNKVTRFLSGGMKRRLSLAASLVHAPELLFLDEPTAGIDPILRRKFWDYFTELQEDGRTLIVTTQYVGEAAYCDLVGVMSDGKLLMIDSPEGLRRRAYGGEIVGISTNEIINYEQRKHFQDLPFTKGSASIINDREIEIIVDEADEAIPKLIESCQQQGLTVRKIDKKTPPFDDVFVKLIEMQVENA